MKNIITQNSKLKKTSKEFGVRVFNFGIPAYRTAKGKVTCPFADSCVKFCYARKGAYIWSNVKPAFEKRYELTQQDDFVDIMVDEIVKKKADYVRVHDSGDFYSPAYLQKWIDIAKRLPNIRFYAYTNSIKMIKDVELTDNWDIIFSDSGKQVNLIDKDKDRHTKIFHSHDELISAGYVDTSEFDLYATKWFNKTNKVGLIIH
jgi:hypothetical protein